MITSADLYLESTMRIDANDTDPILRKYASNIKDFGYLTSAFDDY